VNNCSSFVFLLKPSTSPAKWQIGLQWGLLILKGWKWCCRKKNCWFC